MSVVSGTLTFGLPDSNYNQLLIYTATTEAGSYSLINTLTYKYPEQVYDYGNIEENNFYKIRFKDSVTNEIGPLSDSVPGSGFQRSKPFFQISDNYDGASYNCAQDLYDYTNLTTADASIIKVEKALKKARAYIDLKLGDSTYNRYSNTWDSNISRRKYNATLELIKECELNLATSIIFKNMSDDEMLKQVRGETSSFANISIGQTSLTENGSKNPIEIANFLMLQATKYASEAASVLTVLLPSTVPLIYDNVNYNLINFPRFVYPWFR